MVNSEGLALSDQNLRRYLIFRGLAAEAEEIRVREMGGGVSNAVFIAEWPRQPDRRWVVKQSLAKLRVKDDWRSERGRIFREADAILSLGEILGWQTVPEIIDIDRSNYLYIMKAAPAGSESWKYQLLAGKVDLNVARQAGELLARVMQAGGRRPELRERFLDQTVFNQLRIDPYYRTTAARHPELNSTYEQLIDASRNIRAAVVHGDYSPKNMLVKNGAICLIDFEVVHWGDPAFDAGFLLNHLLLKAFHRREYRESYCAAAREFWRALVESAGREHDRDFERMTVWHLGGLMVARIDGKSPVEYIRDNATKQRVIGLGSRLLLEPEIGVQQAIEQAGQTQ